MTATIERDEALAAKPDSAPEPRWGQDLNYADWIKPWLPAMHTAFLGMNKYMSVPALRAGLGRYMSNPLTGYLMILRARGRRSGVMKDFPLGYVVMGDAVYCIAGFGRQTNWYRNVLADPHVELILPSRAFSGLAEEVTAAAERRAILPVLIRSMGVIAALIGMGNAWRDTPDEIVRKCEGMPLVRVRATGIAAGPDDFGGWSWVVPIAATAVLGVLLMRRGGSRK